jgi:hypothetical protein
MLKSLPLTLLATAAGITTAFAQSNFRPGYVVPTTGDTLHGLVDNRSALVMTRLMRFKPTADAPIVDYTPAQLRAAGFTPGAAYESMQVDGGPAFMAVLAKGPVSLYRFSDANDRMHYYVLSPALPLTELVQRDTTQEAFLRGATHLVKVRSYPFRQVLAKAFTGCYAITSDLARAELRESTLTRLFQSYYACQGSSVAGRVATQRKAKANFSLIGGVSQGTINFVDYGTQTKFETKARPVFGVGLSYTPGNFNEKLALELDALYNKNDEQGKYNKQRFDKIQYTIDMHWHTVMVPALFRYTFVPHKAVSPFVQLGPQATLRLNGQASYIIHEDLYGGSVFNSTAPIYVNPFTIHGVIGAGLQISMGSIGSIRPEVRYMTTDNISDPAVLSHETALNFLLTYTFGK